MNVRSASCGTARRRGVTRLDHRRDHSHPIASGTRLQLVHTGVSGPQHRRRGHGGRCGSWAASGRALPGLQLYPYVRVEFAGSCGSTPLVSDRRGFALANRCAGRSPRLPSEWILDVCCCARSQRGRAVRARRVAFPQAAPGGGVRGARRRARLDPRSDLVLDPGRGGPPRSVCSHRSRWR